jgi:hypothetical protein
MPPSSLRLTTWSSVPPPQPNFFLCPYKWNPQTGVIMSEGGIACMPLASFMAYNVLNRSYTPLGAHRDLYKAPERLI